ncbi:MAG: hypothetical protein GF349_03210 [Candidatus Magasanikbacteria bacterium]|nr:hypothetical protein [Candidatus Magasanikbacteria bacterium]
MWLCFGISFLFIFLLDLLTIENYKKIKNKKIISHIDNNSLKVFSGVWPLQIIFLSLLFCGFYLLFDSKSNEALMSPWQAINQYYPVVFFLLIFILGLLIFSNTGIKKLLIFLFSFSLLLHSYLPLSHSLPWGGDVWRLLGTEKAILSEEFVPPVLIGPEARWIEVMNIDLPEVFFVPQKFAYSHFWSANSLLSQSLHIDLVDINRWLMPILWSFFLPLMLFRLGHLIFRNWRAGVILAWVSTFLFTFQALGSLSVPVSLGFIFFMLAIIFWIQYFQEKQKRQLYFCLGLTAILLLGYTLHLVLLVILLLSVLIYKAINKIKNDHIFVAFKIGLLILLGTLIPVIELISKISIIDLNFNWMDQFKKFIGVFSGWYYATAIRSHDIVIGNIFYNHTPDYAFVSNLFNSWRYFLIPLMIIFWLLIFYGFYILVVKKYRLHNFFISAFFCLSFGAYIIGWFFMSGDRLFVRRLDHILALVFIILLLTAVFSLLKSSSHLYKNSYKHKIIVTISLLISSLFATVSYTSGPDMRVVSQNEHEAALFLNKHIQNNSINSVCVVADTWFLLALEGVSGSRIVGGGFPIDYQFGQSERVEIFNKLKNKPNKEFLAKAKEISQKNNCFLVLDSQYVKSIDKRQSIDVIIGSEAIYEENIIIWKF